VLRLVEETARQKEDRARRFVFEGLCARSIDRPTPGTFTLLRVADGKRVPLQVAEDADDLSGHSSSKGEKRQVSRRIRSVSKGDFREVRLYLESGRYDAKGPQGKAGRQDLFGRASLEAGVRYRLTWTCRPVGSPKTVEASCEFTPAK
jgi:hypothetical protein